MFDRARPLSAATDVFRVGQTRSAFRLQTSGNDHRRPPCCWCESGSLPAAPRASFSAQRARLDSARRLYGVVIMRGFLARQLGQIDARLRFGCKRSQVQIRPARLVFRTPVLFLVTNQVTTCPDAIRRLRPGRHARRTRRPLRWRRPGSLARSPCGRRSG